MKRRAAILSCLGLALQAPPARAQRRRVEVGFDEGSLPTMYRQPSGAAAGVYPGIVAAAGELLGWQLRLEAKPFKRMMADVLSGAAAGGALIRTPEREAIAVYSQPYYTERLQVFSARGRVPVFRMLADLEGARVGVIRGWAYGQAFDAARRAGRFKAEEVNTGLQNFGKLARGRLDYVVATELEAQLFAPQAGGGLLTSEVFIAEMPIHLILRNTVPDAAAVVAEFDGAIRQLGREGLARIVERECQLARDFLPAWQAMQRG